MRTGIAHKSYGGFTPTNSGRCLIWRRFGEFETLSFSRKSLKWLNQAIICVAPGSSGARIEISRVIIDQPNSRRSHPDLRVRGLKSIVALDDDKNEVKSHPDLRVRGLK